MDKELLLLRHGKSDWSMDTDDFHRPLKDRGKRGAQRLGIWLQQQNLQPDFVLSSPAERAITTTEKLCKAMGYTVQQINRDTRIYASDTETLKKILSECPAHAMRVLLVGHNPDLEELLIHLTGGKIDIPEDGKLMATATLARLKMPDNWNNLNKGCAQILSVTRATSLPKGFPFITTQGVEIRKRPAYYYSQSSVLPYRVNNGKLSFLLILSSKRNHWVIPKGIIEPGMTAQASAAREAREEAGVEGEVSDLLLGSYQYAKWGANCSVQVFPMAVTRVIPIGEWEENHRDRKWFSAEKVATLLKQKELRPLVEKMTRLVNKK